MRYDFDEPINRRESDSLKWSANPPDVIPMWIADMDFVSPEPVIQALHERVEHGVFGYPQGIDGMPEDLPGLRGILVARLADCYAWNIRPEDLVFMSGIVVGFNTACYSTASPGSATLIQTPVYPPILAAARRTGCIHQEASLVRLPDGSYSIDWQLFEGAFTSETSTFILCNPHNPVGRVYRVAELERMAEICLHRGAIICSDEIHCDLVYPGNRHVPIASLHPDIAWNTITLISPSKTFNLAGLQFSAAVIQNPELRRKYKEANKGLTSWVNLMGLTAAQAAYQYGADWLQQLLAYLDENRRLVYEFVNRELPGVSMALPEATYLAWLDCREARLPISPQKFFLEKARVALSAGETFGPGGEGFVRLNFGLRRALLQEGLERMKVSLLRDY